MNNRATEKQYDHVSSIMDLVSFRKFGNAFRKNIDSFFKAEYNTAAVGGWVSASFPWSEVASYIVGDQSYSMNTKQYKNFCKHLGIKPQQ